MPGRGMSSKYTAMRPSGTTARQPASGVPAPMVSPERDLLAPRPTSDCSLWNRSPGGRAVLPPGRAARSRFGMTAASFRGGQVTYQSTGSGLLLERA